MFRKVELRVIGLICVASFVGVILVSAIVRKITLKEGTKRSRVGAHAPGPVADEWRLDPRFDPPSEERRASDST
jgi:hypothetical protein